MENLTIKDIDFIDKVMLEYESSLMNRRPAAEAMMRISRELGEAALGEDLNKDNLYNELKGKIEQMTIWEPEQIKRLRAKLLVMRDEILTTIPETDAKTN